MEDRENFKAVLPSIDDFFQSDKTGSPYPQPTLYLL